jgi:hypothetical protein
VHDLRRTYNRHMNHFGRTPIVLLGDGAEVKARFSPFGDMLIMAQDRCIVCGKHTIGSGIVLDETDGTPR